MVKKINFFLQIFLFIIIIILISSDHEFEKKLKNALIDFTKRNDSIETTGDSIIYKSKKNETFEKQSINDRLIIYKTFFPENKIAEDLQNKFNNVNITEENRFLGLEYLLYLHYRETLNSFKKIIFTIIENGLYYHHQENFIINFQNRSDSYLWPHNFASLFCHGGRILFLDNKKLDKNLKDHFFGDNHFLLKPRSTSSHKVQYDNDKKTYEEKKIFWESVVDWMKSLLDDNNSCHYGLNIPIGGFGNYWPDGKSQISFMGYGKNTNKTMIKDPLQNGHLFVRIDNFDESDYSTILLGLEEEAVNYRGMFSEKVHDFLNALKAPTTSVCGGEKWNDLKSKLNLEVPNNIGGRVVYVEKMESRSVLEIIEKYDEFLLKKIWWVILSLNSKNNQIFLEILKNKEQEELKKYFNDLIN